MLTKKSAFYHLLFSLGIILLLTFSTVQAGYQSQSSIPGYVCYRDSASIIQSLQTLASDYPELVQLSSIGNSWEGQPIYALLLTNQSKIEPKPHLVLVSGLRANAFAPVELSLRFAEELLASYDNNSDNGWLLDHFELHLIVLANPDGRARAESQAQDGDDITWQNNTHNTCLSQDIGVRLNQNFPYEWDVSNACDPAYSGPSAESESETQAISNYLQELATQPEPILLLHLDSYQNEFLSPYLSNPTAANPHINDLYTLAEKIGYNTLSGPVRQGDTEHQPSYGTLIDYSFGNLGIPSLVFSMGDFLAGENSSYCWYFDEYLLEKNLSALFRALKVSADPYHQSYGPEIEILAISQNMYRIFIEGSANDFEAWFGGADLYSQVKSIKFSIDLPPWHPQATSYTIPNLTQDPEQNYISHFSYDIDYSLFSPGELRIFFQAWDMEANGNQSNPGLVEAIDIFIPYRQFIPMISRK
ncbi:MAG TPA: hypothetical protein DD636_07110 [Anaerolineaceae bacterium]|nr:hypothetical protein [Anaerolineaceae bacterium]